MSPEEKALRSSLRLTRALIVLNVVTVAVLLYTNEILRKQNDQMLHQLKQDVIVLQNCHH